MKHYSYFLFPPLLIAFGYGIILFSVYFLIMLTDYSDAEEISRSVVGFLGIGMIGLIIVTFRNKITIAGSGHLVKHYKVFGLTLSKEKVKIPGTVSGILLKRKLKSGRGYIQAVVGFGYTIESTDVYFQAKGGIVRIINTDMKRAIRIAEIIKDELKIDFHVE